MSIASKPVYMGGDATVNPFIQIDSVYPPTSNPISFFTGESDYSLTRTYGLWNGMTNVMLPTMNYTSTLSVAPTFYNPWNADVPVIGTDGMQFSGAIDSSMGFEVFVNELSRPMALINTNQGAKGSEYKKLSLFEF